MSTTSDSLTLASTPTSSATETCISIAPGKDGYLPPEACGNLYGYVPSLAAAVLFCVLFGICTLAHLFQCYYYKKVFCWVIIMGAVWEFMALLFRALGTRHQNQNGYLMVNQLFFLLAPLWINAFLYMVLGRLVYFFDDRKRLVGISAARLAALFVLLDIVSFLVQAAGASLTISDTAPQSTIMMGVHIYMGGIGLQELFILCYAAITIKFQRKIAQMERNKINIEKFQRGTMPWRWAFYGVYGALFMITVRIIYRLAEYSRGTDSNNPTASHEWFQYVWDATPMFFAFVILSILHPARVLVGPDSEFPRLSRKEKKALKAERKRQKADKKALEKGIQLNELGRSLDEENSVGMNSNNNDSHLHTPPTPNSYFSGMETPAKH